MDKRLYILKKDDKGFKQGDLVYAYPVQKYKTKTNVTNFEKIGIHQCCKCPIYKQGYIENKHLEYIGNL